MTDATETTAERWKRLARKHEQRNRKLNRAMAQARAQLDEAEREIDHLRAQINVAQVALAAIPEGHDR